MCICCSIKSVVHIMNQLMKDLNLVKSHEYAWYQLDITSAEKCNSSRTYINAYKYRQDTTNRKIGNRIEHLPRLLFGFQYGRCHPSVDAIKHLHNH